MVNRAQIEAVKEYLRAEGFVDVDDPDVIQTRAAERDFHVGQMFYGGQRRRLQFSYSWLQERTPTDLREELARRDVAGLVRTDSPVAILGDGTLQHPI